MINTTCPKCNAPHAKNLKIIYQEGVVSTNQVSVSSVKTNLILNPKIDVVGSISGQNKTALSESISPPEPPNMNDLSERTSIVFILIVMVLIIIYGIYSRSFLYVVAAPFIAAVIAAVYSEIKRGTEEGKKERSVLELERERRMSKYKEDMDKWEKTFMCMQCGEKFIPNEF